jgi:type II secretion system protein G
MRQKSRYLAGIAIAVVGAGCSSLQTERDGFAEQDVLKATQDARSVALAIRLFELDTGGYPTQEQGLASLFTNPGLGGWSGPYLETQEIPLDPWDTPYQYEKTDSAFSVQSAGPDRQFGTSDDVNVR